MGEEQNIDIVSAISTQVASVLSGMMPDGALPDPEIVNFYQLAQQRILWLDFEVNETVVTYSKLILQWNLEDVGVPVEERTPIRLLILNYGGDMDMAYAMIDVIETSETPIYTYNMGVAASAASMILMCGVKRYAMPHSSVLIHQGSASAQGDMGKFIDASKTIQKAVKKNNEFILGHTSIPAATLSKKKANDWTLTATEAVQYGVVDEIISNIGQVLTTK